MLCDCMYMADGSYSKIIICSIQKLINIHVCITEHCMCMSPAHALCPVCMQYMYIY